MTHSIAVSSKHPLFKVLLRCDIEEICFRNDMIEAGKIYTYIYIYIDLGHQAWSR